MRRTTGQLNNKEVGVAKFRYYHHIGTEWLRKTVHKFSHDNRSPKIGSVVSLKYSSFRKIKTARSSETSVWLHGEIGKVVPVLN
jgi:hypothetical protein